MSESTTRQLSVTRQAKYERRKQQGVKLAPNPWSWLTLADVQKLAVDAYKVASHQVHGLGWPHDKAREYFADELMVRFSMFLAVKAVEAGMPLTVVPGVGPNEQSVIRDAARLRKKVANWRPQYPVYQQVTPASAANASGVVINADEGNVNEHDSKG